MKHFNKVAAQGELRFIRVGTVADAAQMTQGLTAVQPVGGKLVVGHSETGHHHVMDPEVTTMYQLPDSILECLLVTTKPDVLKHLRDFDTHEPLAFAPGVYKVVTAREHTPEGWRKTVD